MAVRTKIEAIIFDFFDVVHADPQKAWLLKSGYDRAGGFAEASDLLDAGHIGYTEYLDRLAHHSGQEAKAIHEFFQKVAVLDTSVVEIIKSLRADYKTALVSNAHKDELRPILEKYHLNELFDEIVISSEVGIVKPAPEIFRLILTRLGVTAGSAVFIDDSPANVAAAQQAGLNGITHLPGDTLALRAGLKRFGINI